jgi:hypothetical protein
MAGKMTEPTTPAPPLTKLGNLWLTARHGKAGVAEAVDAMTSHARGGPMADDERETVISECAYEYYLHMNMTKDVNQGRSKCSSEFLALPTTKAREALFHLSCLAKLPADSQIYESAVSWIEELAAALNIDPSDEGYAVVYLLLRTQARAASTKHRHAPARRADGAVDAIPFAQAVCAPLRKSPMDWKGGKQALTKHFARRRSTLEEDRYLKLMTALEAAQKKGAKQEKQVQQVLDAFPESGTHVHVKGAPAPPSRTCARVGLWLRAACRVLALTTRLRRACDALASQPHRPTHRDGAMRAQAGPTASRTSTCRSRE